MCEIFFAIGLKKPLNTYMLKEIGKQALISSYCNNDGYGWFNSNGKIYKCSSKFNENSIKVFVKKNINKKWVVLHLRKATSGKVNINNEVIDMKWEQECKGGEKCSRCGKPAKFKEIRIWECSTDQDNLFCKDCGNNLK